MELVDLSWARLVLDHGSTEAIVAAFAGLLLGIPIAVGAIVAMILYRRGRPWRSSWLITSIVAFVIVAGVLISIA